MDVYLQSLWDFLHSKNSSPESTLDSPNHFSRKKRSIDKAPSEIKTTPSGPSIRSKHLTLKEEKDLLFSLDKYIKMQVISHLNPSKDALKKWQAYALAVFLNFKKKLFHDRTDSVIKYDYLNFQILSKVPLEDFEETRDGDEHVRIYASAKNDGEELRVYNEFFSEQTFYMIADAYLALQRGALLFLGVCPHPDLKKFELFLKISYENSPQKKLSDYLSELQFTGEDKCSWQTILGALDDLSLLQKFLLDNDVVISGDIPENNIIFNPQSQTASFFRYNSTHMRLKTAVEEDYVADKDLRRWKDKLQNIFPPSYRKQEQDAHSSPSTEGETDEIGEKDKIFIFQDNQYDLLSEKEKTILFQKAVDCLLQSIPRASLELLLSDKEAAKNPLFPKFIVREQKIFVNIINNGTAKEIEVDPMNMAVYYDWGARCWKHFQTENGSISSHRYLRKMALPLHEANASKNVSYIHGLPFDVKNKNGRKFITNFFDPKEEYEIIETANGGIILKHLPQVYLDAFIKLDLAQKGIVLEPVSHKDLSDPNEQGIFFDGEGNAYLHTTEGFYRINPSEEDHEKKILTKIHFTSEPQYYYGVVNNLTQDYWVSIPENFCFSPDHLFITTPSSAKCAFSTLNKYIDEVYWPTLKSPDVRKLLLIPHFTFWVLLFPRGFRTLVATFMGLESKFSREQVQELIKRKLYLPKENSQV